VVKGATVFWPDATTSAGTPLLPSLSCTDWACVVLHESVTGLPGFTCEGIASKKLRVGALGRGRTLMRMFCVTSPASFWACSV
jgi:hypothetical protein